MKVSFDGGETFVEADDVLVIYKDMAIPGEDEDGELHVKLTHEGLVLDVWASQDEPGALDYNIGTFSETADEIIDRLVESNN